ncbi:hypothetical protein SAMN02910292_02195 [Lachnospiraceae bacterium XBB2008]|nr:hypothetical protein SAMN02910292_02195 [Lachnospiraceae bacterium XBB2008]
MAAYDLSELYTKYEGFYFPIARVYIGDKDPEADKKINLRVTDFNVEITSEFKAGIASFSIKGGFSEGAGSYDMDKLKKYAMLGQSVRIYMGHASSMTEVFRGYVAMVNFQYLPDTDIDTSAFIRITAMDVKGIMMANNSSKRLKANYYSDAVKEILEQKPYQDLQNREIITDLAISDTPDKPGGDGPAGAIPGGGLPGGGLSGGAGGEGPDNRIEMVAESDYEFVVKVAKKFNFEFFTIGGNVAFRPAKSNTQELIEIIPSIVIKSFDVGYDITGVVGQVKVRSIDIGKGNKVEVTQKNNATFSLGNKAKPLISNQAYVYTDSSVESQDDATRRASYIMEDMSYRFGTINMTLSGMPELVPGRFIKLKDFGSGISNKFYLTDVIHEYNELTGYTTTIIGRAATLEDSNGLL